MEKNGSARYFTISDVDKVLGKIISSHSLGEEKPNGRYFKVRPVEISDDEIESAFIRAARRVNHHGE